MAVRWMPRAGRVQVGPAASDPVAGVADPEISKDLPGGLIEAFRELAQPGQRVQPVIRLPTLPGLEVAEGGADLTQDLQNRIVHRPAAFEVELSLPHEAREHP